MNIKVLCLDQRETFMVHGVSDEALPTSSPEGPNKADGYCLAVLLHVRASGSLKIQTEVIPLRILTVSNTNHITCPLKLNAG